jgi:hypothetical protein
LWPATAPKCQQDSLAWFKTHSNMNSLNQNVGKQRKNNCRKITKTSVSLTFLTLSMEQDNYGNVYLNNGCVIAQFCVLLIIKRIQIRKKCVNNGTWTYVVCFQRVLLSCINTLS